PTIASVQGQNAAEMKASAYLEARRQLDLLRREVRTVFANVDLLICRPDRCEYPQYSSVFCPRAALALPPFRLYDHRSPDWSPNCWGTVRGVNRSGAGERLRARNGMAQKTSETRSSLRLPQIRDSRGSSAALEERRSLHSARRLGFCEHRTGSSVS